MTSDVDVDRAGPVRRHTLSRAAWCALLVASAFSRRAAAARPVTALAWDDRPLDTLLLDGVRVRQTRGMLTIARGGRTLARVALDTLIRADGDFSVAVVDASGGDHPRGGSAPERYLVLHVTGGSNTRDPRGRCGAGTEGAVVWLALDPAARVRHAQSVLVASCRTTREADVDRVALTGDSLAVPFWVAASDSSFVLHYRRREPDRGLVVTPTPAKIR